MPANAARLAAPLLYVVGTADPLQRGPDEIFAKAPPHPLDPLRDCFAPATSTRQPLRLQPVNTWLRAVR